MKRKSGKTFGSAYFIYLCLVVFLTIAAIVYVRVSLGKYRDSLPERIVEAQIEELRNAASAGSLWDEYIFPEVKPGRFEENIDLKTKFANLLMDKNVTYALKAGSVTDSEQTYNILSEDTVLAEICVKRSGEEKTKLFILNFSEWSLKDVSLSIKPHGYKIDVPYDFSVSVNGVLLGDGEKTTENGVPAGYSVDGLYLTPTFSIKDKDGVDIEFNISGSVVKAALFDYSLTLPRTLKVSLNGEDHKGDETTDGLIRHDIRSTSKPSVKISDMYGNTVSYEGENDLSLTYVTIKAPGGYVISVDGVKAPDGIKEKLDIPSIDIVRRYDSTAPEYYSYCVAILKKDADVKVTNASGEQVSYDKDSSVVDLTEASGDDTIPADISAEVDVISVAKKWSLFMSTDLEGASYGLHNIVPYLIEGSPLYDSAVKWVGSIDITFISPHTLGNPPFSETSIKNFTKLSANSFFVDITLVKDMYVNGNLVPDKMNNRFYFVKPDGGASSWKLADMS